MALQREIDYSRGVIPDWSLSEGGKFEWGRGNHLLVYGSSVCRKPQSDRPSKFSPCSPKIHQIKWDTSLQNPATRKLVNESHAIFLTLQKLVTEVKDNALKEQLVKISRRYRSVLSACVENLQNDADSAHDGETKNEYILQSELFYKLELIWNLCEILFIDIKPGGVILCQLLEWIRLHFTEGDRKMEVVLEQENPWEQQEAWDAVFCFVFQGRTEDARKLLQTHPNSSRDDFSSMDELLRKMPFYQSVTTYSLTEFKLRWHHWQDECRCRLQDGEFAAVDGLEATCKILCGDWEMFQELSELCETWYHLMVSRLLYTDPTVKAHDLFSIAQECITMFDSVNQMTHLDNTLLAAMEFDLQQVIRECGLYLDSWWFVAHLTDLLHHGGQLDLQQLSYSKNLREFQLIDYASSLMSHQSLWQIGVDYFDHCPVLGRQYLELFLERIPLTSEIKTRKVLALAEKREMFHLARSIAKIKGMNALRNGMLGTALTWAVKSKDACFASVLADKFLVEYSESGQFTSPDLLDNLGSCMLVSDRLTFLGKYREFHKMYEEKEFKEASALLVSLLASRLAPKYFWVTLLFDALPLLESEEVVFSSRQTFQLMYCLEELQQKTDKPPGLKEKEDLLRLALTRNLARAFISEGSQDL
ncbi:nuclear pore complex protein Nup75 isoform X2 [Tachypleus tridentatus]|uniref:nuclear pore complex protein Nup75 isoform X2 n=1 Tax=Tachypleus tridentatus TaxID=6853 RepID=UPI003FD21672